MPLFVFMTSLHLAKKLRDLLIYQNLISRQKRSSTLICNCHGYLLFKCFLGLEFLNTNISGEMAQFLMSVQTKYVPQMTSGDGKTILQPIFLDGDQLTEERARNVQLVFQDGDDQFDRLQGLDPTHADWHAKVNLYKVFPKGTSVIIMYSLSGFPCSLDHLFYPQNSTLITSKIQETFHNCHYKKLKYMLQVIGGIVSVKLKQEINGICSK